MADLPADVIALGVQASDAYTDRAEQWTDAGHVRAILAATTPRIKAFAVRELAAEAEGKPGSYWVHIAAWMRRRADEIERGNTDGWRERDRHRRRPNLGALPGSGSGLLASGGRRVSVPELAGPHR